VGEPIPDINPNGTMALTWTGKREGGREEVLGRGLIEGWRSCIFRGWLENDRLTIRDRVISYHNRTLTDDGKRVYGIEDPTPTPWGGFWATEAYWQEGESGRLGTNIIQVTATRAVMTIHKPHQVQAWFKPADYFTGVNMVKEPQLLDRETESILCEVSGNQGERRQSRIVHVEGNTYFPFLEPVEGTWFDAHVSTAANPLELPDGTKLLIFNGAKRVRERQVIGEETREGMTNRWAVGAMRLNTLFQPIWWTSCPLIVPPKGEFGPAATSEPTAPGQRIAFASDARIIDRAGTKILQILYHRADKFCHLAELEVMNPA
jgi:hypothetical protein